MRTNWKIQIMITSERRLHMRQENANIIIWIVKKAREEHRLAVEWLNSHTDDDIGFFLLEIELWSINQSSPAVKFNVVERPNTHYFRPTIRRIFPVSALLAL